MPPFQFANVVRGEEMITIKGIGMPTGCYSCRFSKFPYDSSKEPYCTIVYKHVKLSHFDRPKWCPLVEVKDDEIR